VDTSFALIEYFAKSASRPEQTALDGSSGVDAVLYTKVF